MVIIWVLTGAAIGVGLGWAWAICRVSGECSRAEERRMDALYREAEGGSDELE